MKVKYESPKYKVGDIVICGTENPYMTKIIYARYENGSWHYFLETLKEGRATGLNIPMVVFDNGILERVS